MLLIWLTITVVAAIVEILTVDLVSIWFAAGGVVALVAQLIGLSQTIQIVLFVIVSLICIIASRPLAKKYLRTNIVSTNSDRVIGQHGLVIQTIDADTKGEVKVLSTHWHASSIDNSTIEAGEYCEILAIEGNHLIVKKSEK